MSAGSYLLVRFDERAKLPSVAASLDSMKAVNCWHATDGYYGLVVETRDDSAVKKELEKLDGFAELARCEIVSDGKKKNINAEEVQSYLLAEIESLRSDEVFKTLNDHENVVSCVSCTGDFDLIAIVTGRDFDDVDRIVDRDLRLLDGVLRLKQNRIINLEGM